MVTSGFCREDVQADGNVLSGIVEQASSLQEIEDWLRSQGCVVSVTLARSLIKTNPPQRELTIGVQDASGARHTLVLSLFSLPNGTFRVRDLRRI